MALDKKQGRIVALNWCFTVEERLYFVVVSKLLFSFWSIAVFASTRDLF